MGFIDNVIKYMVDQRGSAFTLATGKNIVLQVGEQSYPQNQKLNHDQLITILRETTPAAMQSMIGQTEKFEFAYANSLGKFLFKVTQANGVVELKILPQQATSAKPEPHAAAAAGAPTGASVIESESPAAKYLNVPESKIGTRRCNHMDELFHILAESEGSDVHCSSLEHPIMRVHGTLYKMPEFEKWTSEYLHEKLWEICPERNREEWEDTHDTDFAYEMEGFARFRCNLMSDRHGIAGVFRIIPSKIATVEDLKLPKAMVDLCYLSKGLVVVTGPTGSGKSTTLAALVDHVNKTRTDHIITIEDPIEFVHENNRCLVNQREIHVHTEGFKKALRAALREDPDIVLVGEMRDLETVAIAIETAETGHLVFGTLHTSSAASTVDRIIDQFPSSQQEQIRVMLSESLKAIIAQTLFKKKGGGRIAAWEILLCPPSVSNLIREKKTFQLNSMIQVNKAMGMITMNDAVMKLIKDDLVEPMEAYMKVIDKTGLAMMFEKENVEFTPPTFEEMIK